MLKRGAPVLIALLAVGCGEPKGLTRPYSQVKAEFERVCTGCHTLDPVMNKHRDLAEWTETVARMRVRGAKLEEWMLHDFPLHLTRIRGR